jgi:cell division protein FtsB
MPLRLLRGGLRMGRLLAAAQRALLFIAVWGFASAMLIQAGRSCVQHQQLAREVAGLQQQYDQQMKDYAGQLAEGERLKHDKDYQIELLKKRFGYTRPNETPIIVDHEEPAAETGK